MYRYTLYTLFNGQRMTGFGRWMVADCIRSNEQTRDCDISAYLRHVDTYCYVIVGTVTRALHIKIQEGEHYSLAFLNCDQPLAVCVVGVILGVVLRYQGPCGSAEVTTTS